MTVAEDIAANEWRHDESTVVVTHVSAKSGVSTATVRARRSEPTWREVSSGGVAITPNTQVWEVWASTVVSAPDIDDTLTYGGQTWIVQSVGPNVVIGPTVIRYRCTCALQVATGVQ